MTAAATNRLHSCPLCRRVVAISGDTPGRPKPTADSDARLRAEAKKAKYKRLLETKHQQLLALETRHQEVSVRCVA